MPLNNLLFLNSDSARAIIDSNQELTDVLNAIVVQSGHDAVNPSYPGYSEITVGPLTQKTLEQLQARNFLYSKTSNGFKISW